MSTSCSSTQGSAATAAASVESLLQQTGRALVKTPGMYHGRAVAGKEDFAKRWMTAGRMAQKVRSLDPPSTPALAPLRLEEILNAKDTISLTSRFNRMYTSAAYGIEPDLWVKDVERARRDEVISEDEAIYLIDRAIPSITADVVEENPTLASGLMDLREMEFANESRDGGVTWGLAQPEGYAELAAACQAHFDEVTIERLREWGAKSISTLLKWSRAEFEARSLRGKATFDKRWS